MRLHSLLIPLIALVDLTGSQTAVTWSSPKQGDIYTSGDAIITTWYTSQPVVSPSFQLCAYPPPAAGMPFDCGQQVWPTVVTADKEYSIALAIPSIPYSGTFYIMMKSDFGVTYNTPSFELDPSPPPVATAAATPPSFMQSTSNEAAVDSSGANSNEPLEDTSSEYNASEDSYNDPSDSYDSYYSDNSTDDPSYSSNAKDDSSYYSDGSDSSGSTEDVPSSSNSKHDKQSSNSKDNPSSDSKSDNPSSSASDPSSDSVPSKQSTKSKGDKPSKSKTPVDYSNNPSSADSPTSSDSSSPSSDSIASDPDPGSSNGTGANANAGSTSEAPSDASSPLATTVPGWALKKSSTEGLSPSHVATAAAGKNQIPLSVLPSSAQTSSHPFISAHLDSIPSLPSAYVTPAAMIAAKASKLPTAAIALPISLIGLTALAGLVAYLTRFIRRQKGIKSTDVGSVPTVTYTSKLNGGGGQRPLMDRKESDLEKAIAFIAATRHHQPHLPPTPPQPPSPRKRIHMANLGRNKPSPMPATARVIPSYMTPGTSPYVGTGRQGGVFTPSPYLWSNYRTNKK